MRRDAMENQTSSTFDPAEYLIEQLGMIRLNADIAQSYVAAGDGPGLNYQLRHLTARIRAVVGVVNDLQMAETPEAA